jgi:hypothetical protein
VRIQRKFHSGSFAARHEIGYSILGQLHDLSGKRKKFITLANRDVCENAWYIIQDCHADIFGRMDGRSDDGRGGVRDLDAL